MGILDEMYISKEQREYEAMEDMAEYICCVEQEQYDAEVEVSVAVTAWIFNQDDDVPF